jgi:hypothetical protein
MAKVQSVEPNIADIANGWLKSYIYSHIRSYRIHHPKGTSKGENPNANENQHKKNLL